MTEPASMRSAAAAAAVSGAGPTVAPPDLGRATATVSAINAVSRATGFVRVLATGAALGIAALGDTYQGANVVSNVLFELLAGGLLFAVLVPAFVGHVTNGDQIAARRLADVLVGRSLVGLGAVVAVGVLVSPLIARALLSGVPGATRDDQIAVATVLLWFVLPQVVLYAVGAVVTALLQAHHRFVAAAAAPIANNGVVIATMVVFAAVHGTDASLDLDGTDVLILGGGTLLGTAAMTVVVLLAAARSGLAVRPRWRDRSVGPLGALARQGAWGAGHIGLHQVLVLSTVVLAGRVGGGAIAFTTAFTVFLVPHALLAHPLVTTLTPRLAAHAHRGDQAAFANDLGRGLRMLVVLLAPSAALLAALARPGLQLVSGLGAFDDRGVDLVATTLAGFTAALGGYSAFFLLTRAAYAVGDVAGPTIVNLGATATAVAAMVGATAVVDGPGLLATFGIIQGVALTAAAVVLGVRLGRRTLPPPGTLGALARGAAAALAGGAVAVGTSTAIGWEGRSQALAATAAGAALGALAAFAVLRVVGSPELTALRAGLPAVSSAGRRSGRAAP